MMPPSPANNEQMQFIFQSTGHYITWLGIVSSPVSADHESIRQDQYHLPGCPGCADGFRPADLPAYGIALKGQTIWN